MAECTHPVDDFMPCTICARAFVTVHIENVPRAAITDALVAIERADRATYDREQHDRLTALVLGLREAVDG